MPRGLNLPPILLAAGMTGLKAGALKSAFCTPSSLKYWGDDLVSCWIDTRWDVACADPLAAKFLPNGSFIASVDRARQFLKQLLCSLATAKLLEESFPVLGRVLEPGYALHDFVSQSQVSKVVQKYPGHLQEPQLLLHRHSPGPAQDFSLR